MALTAGMVGGILQGVGGLAQMASGIFGKRKRQRELENMLAQRPQYQIPQELSDQLEEARNRKDARIAGSQQLTENIMTSGQNQLANAQRSSGSVEQQLALGSATMGNIENALFKQDQNEQAQRNVNMQNYLQASTNMAQAKDQAFKLNELDPFNQRVQGTMALNQMAREMTFGGLNQMGAGLVSAGTAGIKAGNKGFFGEQ